MTKLDTLISISRHYGSNPTYVLAGGGNTSFKNSEELFIKASGISLSTIDQDGFVCMSREKLGYMEEKEYSENVADREEEVKNDLYGAIVNPGNLRPSVETSLHNLIRYSYVVHTHPTTVNALMCAKNAKEEVERRFGSEALYMEYTDPGYILFSKLKVLIENHEQTYGNCPKIIFLQNHGIFVGANSIQEIKAMYDSIESRIRMDRDLSLPDSQPKEHESALSKMIAGHYSERSLISRSFSSELISHFTESKDQNQKISRPFTPDIIVYCKSKYLFLESGSTEEEVKKMLADFESDNGYYPKVIIEEKQGLIIVEESEKAVNTAMEVFMDMMKISYLSEQFGGPGFMSDEQIAFIDNWEVENYRRSVAKP